ncbi:MAG: hypothetical protein RI947_480 [Candidatus Parcubacteria bacterium]|jgi:ABC-2 type transport system permease protein
MINLYQKELKYYLNNAPGYIVIIMFAVFVNFLFMKDLFVGGSASLRPLFMVLPWLMLIFIPAVAMRTLSEEKRINTIEILLTLPISEAQIVISKFLALLTVFCIGLLLTAAIPVSLAVIAKLYIPEVLVGYSGVMLLGATFISVSMFFSSLTKNQVIAMLSSVIVLFLLSVISTDFVSSVLPKTVQDALVYFSPLYHLENFVNGVIDLRSVFYFLSFTVIFLFLTIIDLEKRD